MCVCVEKIEENMCVSVENRRRKSEWSMANEEKKRKKKSHVEIMWRKKNSEQNEREEEWVRTWVDAFFQDMLKGKTKPYIYIDRFYMYIGGFLSNVCSLAQFTVQNVRMCVEGGSQALTLTTCVYVRRKIDKPFSERNALLKFKGNREQRETSAPKEWERESERLFSRLNRNKMSDKQVKKW